MRAAMFAAACTALALCGRAYAGWTLSAELERFRWAESTSPAVTETGPRFALGVSYRSEREAGWQFGYRGRLYRASRLDYQGSFLVSGAPTSAQTDYSGVENEAQAILRFPQGAGELRAALGWDYWERRILPDQREDYHVAYLRLGLHAEPRGVPAWFGGGGIKLPIYARENAHLDEIGFRDNPALRPKGELSLYGEAGYRFAARWSLTGYYEGYRFGESGAVSTQNPGIPSCSAQCRVAQPASRVDSVGLRLQYRFE